MKKITIALFMTVLLSSCSGLRTSDEFFMAHASSINLFFLQFPSESAADRARDLVPENGNIENLYSTPDDMTSLLGVLNRLVGVNYVHVEGTLDKSAETQTEE